MLTVLTPDQAVALASQLPHLYKTLSNYHGSFLRLFSPLQNNQILTAICANNPDFIQTVNDFFSVLGGLNSEQEVIVIMAHLVNKRFTPNVVDREPNLRRYVMKLVIKSAEDLNHLLWTLPPQKGAAIVLDGLSAIQGTSFNLSDIFWNLNAERRVAIYHAIEPQLPVLMRSSEEFNAFKEEIGELTPATKNILSTKFAMKSIADSGQYPLLEKAMQDYCEDPTLDNIRVFLDQITAEKRPIEPGFFNPSVHNNNVLIERFLNVLPEEIRDQLQILNKISPRRPNV